MFHPRGPSLWELAEQALSSTDRGYDLLAPKFEFTPFRTPDHILDSVGAEIGTAKRGLDICTGTGAGARMLQACCTEEVVGVDRSAGMLAEAASLTDTKGGTPVRYLQIDALEMPFENQFDVAVSFGAFGHILPRDQQRFVTRIHQALAPGGRFLFVTMNPPSVFSRAHVLCHAFNFAMHVRNTVLSPPFHMYYLIFTLPRARELLCNAGFVVDVLDGKIPHPRLDFKIVIATKRS